MLREDSQVLIAVFKSTGSQMTTGLTILRTIVLWRIVISSTEAKTDKTTPKNGS